MAIAHGRRRGPLIAVLIAGSLAGVVLTATTATFAKDDKPWQVIGRLFGKPKDAADPAGKRSKDVSGIACATTAGFPRTCLIVDDETQGAQIVILNDGGLTAGRFIRLIDAVHNGAPLELDAEAVAYADGSFYVLGSHGRPRHEKKPDKEATNAARAAATQHAFRIRFGANAIDPTTGTFSVAPEIRSSTELPRLIKAQADLAPAFNRALEDNGLTIEGVAVRGDTLYAGMRGPVLDNGNATVLAVPLAALFDGSTEPGHVEQLSLGRDTRGNARGIRDLVSYATGFLILAGPVNDPGDGKVHRGDYAIYSWSGTAGAARLLLDLGQFGKAVKPEALLPLDEKDGTLRALVFFDGVPEGGPRSVQIRLR